MGESDIGPPATSSSVIDAVLTHHLDGFRSGVARFNELLAEHLGVPLRGVFDAGALTGGSPLLSLKVSELSENEACRLEKAMETAGWSGDLFLHELSHLPLESALIRRSRRVLCGNREILTGLAGIDKELVPVWTPGLIRDDHPIRPAEISVFSFGMAHKIQTAMFRRLRELLDDTGCSYSILVSAANHETSSIRDAELVFLEMHDIFPDELYFLGNLSDVAVGHYLRTATFFAAFFPGGVRDNNTSVASALERGCIVVTNLDEHSPSHLAHDDSVIDIIRCSEIPTDPLVLARMRVRALESGRARTWSRLVDRIRAEAPSGASL